MNLRQPIAFNPQLKYYVIYKPYGMLSQFSREGEKPTLADLSFKFGKQVYAVGRLDADSEGLLLLTNDKAITDRLLNPKYGHPRTYLAQVEGDVTKEALKKLGHGVEIAVDGKLYKTKPAVAKKLTEEPTLPPRNPPIRFRAKIPTTWVELTLTEGKNRQVRKMCAKVGFPVLRLVRIKIGNIEIADLYPGEVREIEFSDLPL